jgi:hypothetical protein
MDLLWWCWMVLGLLLGSNVWSYLANETIAAGERVKIVAVDGRLLSLIPDASAGF